MIEFLPEFSFIIPFLFTFAVVFGVLSSLKHTDKKGNSSEFMPTNVNVIIALVFAFAVASYEPFSGAILEFLPLAALIVIVMFFFILFMKIFERDVGSAVPALAFLALFLLAIGTFWGQIDKLFNFDYSTSQDALWIVGLLIVSGIIYLGWKADKDDTKEH